MDEETLIAKDLESLAYRLKQQATECKQCLAAYERFMTVNQKTMLSCLSATLKTTSRVLVDPSA